MSTPKADQLIAEFSSFLDEALIIALISDHDLSDPDQLGAARDTLQALAQNVPAEEATGFNPSGVADTLSSMSLDGGGNDGHGARETSAMSQGSSSMAGKDTESCSTALTSPQSDGGDDASPAPALRIRAFEGESDETQIIQLQEMFADLKPHDVQLAFRKAQGDFQTTLEDLLNKQYLELAGERKKGVDGFFRPDEGLVTSKKKKKKGKQRRLAGMSADSSGSSRLNSPAEPSPGEEQSLEDILYVAEKLDLSFEEASEVYQAKHCSRVHTIVEFLDRYLREGVLNESQASRDRAIELSKQYHSVPEAYLPTLVGIVGDVPQWLDELASLLNAHFAKLPPQRLALNYKLTPLANEEIEQFTPVASRRGRGQGTASITGGGGSSSGAGRGGGAVSSSSGAATYQDALSVMNVRSAARDHSYSNASSAIRKGHSNPLFRQAAGFYAERAKEESLGLAGARSAAADLYVSGNSSRDVVDLHGVTVADGVRIAKERVWRWWNSLGEYRALEARQGFTVVTGLGRHSASGVSRLRQSVAAALIEDGWKFSVETGRFRVTGRR